MATTKQMSYFQRFRLQLPAILKKHYLIAFRNWRATLLRITATFIFIFVLYLSDQALRADSKQFDSQKEITNPESVPINPIPRCEDDLYILGDCMDFGYSPQNDEFVEEIVKRMRKNNPDRSIGEDRVKSFKDMKEANKWLLSNPDKMTGVVHFDADVDNKFIGFTIQTNSSVKFYRGDFQHPNLFMQVPLQVAVSREVTRYFMEEANGGPGVPPDWQYLVNLRPFAHPASTPFSLVGSFGPYFLLSGNMFAFVMVMYGIVSEKELGLRKACRTMGMMDSSYWIGVITYEVILGVLTALTMSIFGLIFQFELFTRNAFSLYFTLFLGYQFAQSALALTLVSLIRKAAMAVYVGFMVFIIGFITLSVQNIANFPFSSDYYKQWNNIPHVIFGLMPWNLLGKGVKDLGLAAAKETSDGLTWANRYAYCANEEKGPVDDLVNKANQSGDFIDVKCLLSIGQCINFLFLLSLIYLILAVYFDNVFPDENGVRKMPWYFLNPLYWCPNTVERASSNKGQNNGADKPAVKAPAPAAAHGGGSGDEDVLDEETRMKGKLSDDDFGSPEAVELYDLRKTFGKFVAIKGTWLSLQSGQLFALLGPNGAGKTTTINCLTGVQHPTSGDALVLGERLRSAGGMERIRSNMGVCPQFDILWEELTALEHMRIYGRIKGIPPRQIEMEAKDLLEQVKLTSAANQRAGTYSGGMKRRLSVAIAYLGQPGVVYLDEPTTGMDPVARRYVWDVIESMKSDRVTVLTTHSMEEADILGDRIGIMARGELRCLGSSLRLKQRFGGGYHLSVSLQGGGQAVDYSKVKKLVSEVLRGLEASEENKAYVSWGVGKEQEKSLGRLLRVLEEQTEALGITDTQLSLTTLEEAFLNIAKQAEVEAAQQTKGGKKNMCKFVLVNGDTVFVRKGAETIVSNGVEYALDWGLDEHGSLVLTSAIPQGQFDAGAAVQEIK